MIDPGFIIGLIVGGLILLAGLFVGILCFFNEEPGPGAGFILACLVVGGGMMLAAAYPFDMAYHRYETVSGKVSDVNSRLISDGSRGSKTKYVVTLEGSNQPYGCDDTRCSLIKKGQELRLSCIRTWQYAGTDGFDCNYNQ